MCNSENPASRILSTAKDSLAALQSLVTIIAFLAALWWFFAQRQTAPKIKLEHLISQRQDARDPSRVLVGLEIRVTNFGNTRLELNRGSIHAGNVNPGLPNKDAGGPPEEAKLFEADANPIELEPGEADDCFFTRFTVSSDVRTLSITSSFPTPGERDEYWNSYSLFDLGSNAPAKSAAIFSRGSSAQF